ncbi:hypothetical protein RHGRI_036036 [Rhododendron griersonianum]|uniref:DOMON domain-containing protein n=1 Tax=Rhododendron griersonianum TaxID=479676 RepID=A0AAV6HPX8_9ERIC|nr:hypothetical protein RHGRI_036036 [Rhododendron griersonianum]
MAALQLPALLLCLSIATLLFSPSHSKTCTSQIFTGHKTYANCTDLPTLNATLHWTYDYATSSLSIAFLARPAAPSGWVAWGINPAGPRMLGTQALLAYKKPDGSIAVRTFNLNSTEIVIPSALSFAVSNVSTRYANGMIWILATMALSPNTTSVSHAWNVGSSVSSNGVPSSHEILPDNLLSVGTLELAKSSGTASDGNGTSSAAGPNGGQGHSGGGRIGSGGFGLFASVLIMASFVIWS